MPDPDSIDGDVYLADSTFTGDPALEPLLALGWDLRHDELANVFVTAPDHKIRLGYLPEGDDDGLWRINAYADAFAQPNWGVCFNDRCPTEFVTAFTTVLAQAYTDGPDAYLARPDTEDLDQSEFAAVAPLINRGWKLAPHHLRWGVELKAPDGMAGLKYTAGRIEPEAELTTLEARWHLWGGPPKGPRWYATASSHTPVRLVTAITTSVCDPAPLPRWEDTMAISLRNHAHLTPVTPPPPLVPTPLDVQRTTTRRAPSLGTRSVARWSTTTPLPPAGPTTRPGPHR
ncbi:DUF317 domain-containing protein [Streptomyces sp. x-80]|uniref:DUF317 domain-containing protein n=1 Tax=Streptomyces sp. x-80 TaxID=2789282 RepID=UPI00398184AF